MSKLGLVHYNFASSSLDDFLKFVSQTGYSYVELQAGDVWGRNIDNPEQNAESIREQVESYGLQVSAFAAGNDFVVLEEELIRAQVNRMRRITGLAKILGAPVIRTEGGSPKDSVPESRWLEAMAGCLSRCVEFAEKEEIYFAVDNHGVVTNDGNLQVELFERVGSKYVGANLDTMNYRWFGHDLETVGKFYEIIAPYTLHIHLKDGSGARGDYRGEALGEGEIDLTKAIHCLKEAGYDGVWCCEYEGRENDGTGQKKSYEYMVANL
ncbi:sugar phosphate isomerase/epimerase [Candidatus Poribacteria bacterium]|nr:sugar phosphate isomerase/epimerase [Candidatus Poribacteria bacterium]